MTELLSVLRNRNLGLLSAGRIVSSIGDALYLVAISISLYQYSGGKSVAISAVWLAALIPSILVGAPAGTLAGRLGYRRAMLVADIARAIVLLLMAAVLRPGTWVLVYPLVVVSASFSSLFAPAVTGVIPALVDSRQELLAANSVVMEAVSVAGVVGSAAAGAAAGAGLITPMLLLDAGTFAVSALTVWALRPASRRPASEEEEEETKSGWLAGFALLPQRPLLLFSVIALALPELAAGAVTIWLVPFSIERLRMTSGGVGYLYMALGLGSVVGGVITASLGGNVRLDRLLTIGLIVGSVSLALFGVSTSAAPALVLLLVLGIAEMLEYAAFGTILQQSVPESLIGQVAGSVYPLMTVMTLLGTGLSGVLAPLFGLTPSIVGLSVLALAVTVIAWVTLYVRTRGRPTEAELEKIPAFASLSQNARSWVLRRMRRVRFPAGTEVVRQGERGDTFYIIGEGKAAVGVSAEGRTAVRHLGPGDFFGEIALLRDVPRTATVRAVEPLTVYSLTREDFQELQRRSEEFKEGLLQTANARLDQDTNVKMAVAPRI